MMKKTSGMPKIAMALPTGTGTGNMRESKSPASPIMAPVTRESGRTALMEDVPASDRDT